MFLSVIDGLRRLWCSFLLRKNKRLNVLLKSPSFSPFEKLVATKIGLLNACWIIESVQ